MNNKGTQKQTVSRKLVFICAAGHSGSTLLNLLLGAHPDGIAVGEFTQFPKNLSLDSSCSCGSPISSCQFWQPVVERYGKLLGINLRKYPYRLDLGPIMAGTEIDPSHQTRSRMIRRKLLFAVEYARLRWNIPVIGFCTGSLRKSAENKRDFLRFVLQDAAKDFVVDSSKHYLDALHLFQADKLNTRVLMLVRDGRAVFNSGIQRGMTPQAALQAWARPNRRSLHVVCRHIPESSRLHVGYESLTSDPASELRRICSFLDIEYRSEMLQFANSDSHIANGNRMRLQQSSEIRCDENWRVKLSPTDLAFFDRHAGDLNRQFGYRN